MLSPEVMQYLPMQRPLQTEFYEDPVCMSLVSSYSNEDVRLYLLVKSKILIGHRTISQSFRKRELLGWLHIVKRGEMEPTQFGVFPQKKEPGICFCLCPNWLTDSRVPELSSFLTEPLSLVSKGKPFGEQARVYFQHMLQKRPRKKFVIRSLHRESQKFKSEQICETGMVITFYLFHSV